ncbi:hypothetical protein CMQ_4735 [Grosmannia clavigera kw1407]|uniref:Uncharacterized protein n=1 Tax=Grosmannia clavigera (strain kw1407 / UAMH 11150) TaxID=655863 RepID=F0XTY6_GROCL|nr:uncharacterized protein CMQ_4735 [Grosmannia clavigera kw1407]EFW98883.1 hypothetical protein CMQ_4735 [Grosmannia clavigera kw1407]
MNGFVKRGSSRRSLYDDMAGQDMSATTKVTMSFMKAYKAMRGPHDVEPSPLFSCLAPADGNRGDDGPFRLAGRDEIKMLNDVNERLLGDDFDTKPLFADDEARQTVFYFDEPHTANVYFSTNSVLGKTFTAVADHVLNQETLDLGWTEANGTDYADGASSFVSDDDGDAVESRISPAEFRALAIGCKRNDVDSLRIPIATTASVRPLTPQDKIIDHAHEAGRIDARVFGGRRQFDGDDGDELSPAYRVDQGPARSVLWSPAGVTPERAGLFLSLTDAHARIGGGGSRALPNDVVSAADVRSALRDGWRALRACEAEEAQLAAANARAEAAATVQARQLTRMERQQEQRRTAAREATVAVQRQKQKQARRQRRIVHDVALQLRELQAAVRAAEARLARGREWQIVLARRLRSGEKRLRAAGMRGKEGGGEMEEGDDDDDEYASGYRGYETEDEDEAKGHKQQLRRNK